MLSLIEDDETTHRPVLAEIEDPRLALPSKRIGAARTFEACVVAYLGAVRTPNTLRAYRQDIEDFFRFLDLHKIGRKNAERIERPIADAYISALVKGGASRATIRRRLSVLRGLYEYALDAGVISYPSPFRRVTAPRGKAEPRHPGVSLEEAPGLLAAAEKESPLAHALVSLGLVLGLRASEIVSLRVESLGKERGIPTLRVMGKGSKEETLPIPAGLLSVLNRYIEDRGKSPGPLLLGKDGKALPYHAIHYIVRKVSRSAGLGLRSPHDLRRGTCMALLDLGVSLPETRGLMRHASIETTMRYDARKKAIESSPAFLLSARLLGGKE